LYYRIIQPFNKGFFVLKMSTITPKLIPIAPERIGAPGREEPQKVEEIYPTLFLTDKDFPLLDKKEAGEEIIIIARINVKEKKENDDGEIRSELEFKAIASMEDALSPEDQKELDEKVRAGKIKIY